MRGKELVDKGLAVVMNHLAVYAAVVVFVTSNHTPASVALLFGDYHFVIPVLVAHAVLRFAARGTLVLEGAASIHRHTLVVEVLAPGMDESPVGRTLQET